MVVGEVVEHIVLADGLLFDTATKSLTRHADARWDATLSNGDAAAGATGSIAPGRCALA
jgi:hypothetical protein